MLIFIARRIGIGVVTAFLVLTLIFLAIHIVPGDPVVLLLTSPGSPAPSQEAIQEMRALLGLGDPMFIEYLEYLRDTVVLEFGKSFISGFPVTALIVDRLARSAQIIVFGGVIAVIVGVLLGSLAARGKGAIDSFITMLTTLGIAVPVFVSSVVLILIFAIKLQWLPAGGYAGWSDLGSHFAHQILPAVTLSLPFLANVARITRASILEVEQRDWVRTAQSFGFAPVMIFRKHVLRNASNPVITVVGLQFGKLFGSTVLVEQVFHYPGLSSLLINAILHRDYPVVQGVVIVIALIFITVNIIVDIVYGLMDPRVTQ